MNRIANVIPSTDTQNDWSLDTALGAGLLAAPAAPPPSVDLREAWWKVGDQGSTGSCVGWGTAEGVLRWHFVKANRITQTENLSPRFVWMAAKETVYQHTNHGLFNLSTPNGVAYKAEYGFWAYFIAPTAKAESGNSFVCLNTYNRAEFTFRNAL